MSTHEVHFDANSPICALTSEKAFSQSMQLEVLQQCGSPNPSIVESMMDVSEPGNSLGHRISLWGDDSDTESSQDD